jgi:hypothetical protein
MIKKKTIVNKLNFIKINNLHKKKCFSKGEKLQNSTLK